MRQVHTLSIAQLKAAMAGGLSPVTVLEDTLVRLQHRDGELNAFGALDPEVARLAAADSAERYAAGAARALEGVPVAVKANIDVAGLVTHAGVKAWADKAPAAADAPAVARLREEGAVVLGHLNMHEAALGATSADAGFGAVQNPHRRGHTPGGSSGGSGAAVAAGLCWAALGTDTLGSVRLPAAYCGVYGLKPTNGLVPLAGVVPLAERLDCVGPLARSVDDLEAAMAALADLAPAQPIAAVAMLSAIDDIEIEPAVADAYRLARSLLEGMGVAVRRADFPVSLDHARLGGFLEAAGELDAHPGRARAFSEATERYLGWARAADPADAARWRAAAAAAAERLHAVLASVDAVLTPTAPQAAFPHGGPVRMSQPYFTGLANLAGLPAISLPAGWTADGLPVGVQLIGRPHAERALLDLARKLDQALGGYAPPPDFA